ncbi:type IV pili methyl-accepting chemotaxis transducer N-terminal domain-containing protein [Balneatrix alpica]|uniref:type IV pili methyl-accepting chemotaxis transducer N-terminal domain-containing protein n=1 Tax=Balneatrix alpica TaxID=75684 RepID=UPI002738C312|nr:type IV pili methyl-accepting chemotaxis transducer N-terminal domain-containing protein [Balneatrix alpica]
MPIPLKTLRKSIVARLGSAMFAISLMALVSMLGSVIVAESTRGTATGINIAGSLRMQSYRIGKDLVLHSQAPTAASEAHLQQSLDTMQARLEHPNLASVIPTATEHELNRQYHRILDLWHQRLAPQLFAAAHSHVPTPLGSAPPQWLQELDAFVEQVDLMVHQLEQSTEAKIKLLSLVQGISLFMTVVIIFIAMFDISNNVITPLRELVGMAREASRGNFKQRSSYSNDDELGLLSETFNQMATELQKIYSDLEQRVERKTAQLQQSNDALRLLYETSQHFNSSDDLCHRLIPVLKRLEEVTPFSPISVTLRDPDSQRPYRQVTTSLQERPVYCHDDQCFDCMTPHRHPMPGQKAIMLPVQSKDYSFGEICAEYPPHLSPNDNTIKLLETIADHLSRALLLEVKTEQQQQLSLMEERAVIARELHDSLAQSLSYLKMQVSRLHILLSKDSGKDKLDAVVDELREGLNNAYRQLRELLTTFRLKLDEPGLEPALQSTVREFSERLNFEVELEYGLGRLALNPNEEIHVLQIVREALANVVKHARASWAKVSVQDEEDRILVYIDDNGQGLPAGKDLTNHYGLVIMRDRTNTLHGQLHVANREGGGVRVSLEFSPQRSLIYRG